MLLRNVTSTRPLRLVLLTCWSVVALGLPATAATAPELLEKAIYTEETVGNLDEAIGVYKQVVAEGKDSQKDLTLCFRVCPAGGWRLAVARKQRTGRARSVQLSEEEWDADERGFRGLTQIFKLFFLGH